MNRFVLLLTFIVASGVGATLMRTIVLAETVRANCSFNKLIVLLCPIGKLQ